MIFILLGCLFQQTPPPVPPQTYPVPAAADESGYQAIFDGKTLGGWEGDPKYWRVENGVMVGEVTPETLLEESRPRPLYVSVAELALSWKPVSCDARFQV